MIVYLALIGATEPSLLGVSCTVLVVTGLTVHSDSLFSFHKPVQIPFNVLPVSSSNRLCLLFPVENSTSSECLVVKATLEETLTV